ncbi:hypothetical protein, partial [Mycolicibacterium sp.]|uniref:hypothetical protein n=1 Tax=Mycolicibacterium sp. TaxID=2320850 RepID=UPI0037CA1624
ACVSAPRHAAKRTLAGSILRTLVNHWWASTHQRKSPGIEAERFNTGTSRTGVGQQTRTAAVKS